MGIMKTDTRRYVRFQVFSNFVLALLVVTSFSPSASALTVNHNDTTLSAIPASAITAAKANLKIAYGHTSHGSQLTTGMTGLASWKGSTYAWNGTGADGALYLVDFYGSFGGSDAQDLGNPDFTSWEAATRTYLADHSEINVIIWSWCGELAWATEANANTYLSFMSGLETDFPSVTFIYMTCHLDGTGEAGNLNQRNEQIRTYCNNNGKVLYDFADIESYDPDGLVNYMKNYANDACDYDSNGDTYADVNWATEWQNSHTENIDWYDCESAHSQPLNANRKAYAAWYLWARLGGWNGSSTTPDTTAPSVPTNLTVTSSSASSVTLTWTSSTDNTAVTGYRVYSGGSLLATTASTSFTDTNLTADEAYSYTVAAIDAAGNVSSSCVAVSVRTKHAAPAWSGEADSTTGWYDNSWYGRFYNDENYGNWIFSGTQGFQCFWPTSTHDCAWIWDDATQNWWWTSDTFYPYIYDFTAETWLCYVEGACPNRSFWNYATNRSVSESSL